MAESLEDVFSATQYRRRLQIPEGSYFTSDGEQIYKLVSQNGDQNQISVSPISMVNGAITEGGVEQLYKYGEMVYLVEQND